MKLQATSAVDQGYLNDALREAADRTRMWVGSPTEPGLLDAHAERISSGFSLPLDDVKAEITRLISLPRR